MTYDASNRKDIRAAEKAARAAEIARIDFLKGMMSIPQGRTWLHDLLEFCGCFRGDVSFHTAQDYFNQGMRNVGLRMFSDITTNCPDEYITMMKEANGRRISDDINRSRGAAAGERSDSAHAGRDVEGLDDAGDNFNGDDEANGAPLQ